MLCHSLTTFWRSVINPPAGGFKTSLGFENSQTLLLRLDIKIYCNLFSLERKADVTVVDCSSRFYISFVKQQLPDIQCRWL